MSNDITILIKTKTSGKRDVDSLAKSINTGFNRGKIAVEAFNAAAGNGRKVIQGMSVGMREMVTAYLGIETAKHAFEGMLDILKEAEQAQFNLVQSVTAANREFRNTGDVEYWTDAVKRLSKELVIYSESALRQAVSRTVDMTKRLGLTARQMEEVIKRAADLSAGRTDLEGGIERVTSALRGEAEAAEYLGLTLNENYVKAWYQANTAHEKAWKDLSDLEKAQIRYRVFLEQTEQFQGRAAASARTFGGALQLVKKEIADAVVDNKDLGEAMRNVADFIRENADEIGDMAARLVEVTADIAQFAVQWKEFIALGLTTLGVVRVVQSLSAAYRGLQAAMAAVAATRLVTTITASGAAMAEATLLGVGFSQWLRFGLVMAAGYAAAELMGVVSALRQIAHWQKEAREATRTDAQLDADAIHKLAEISRETGLSIRSLEHFNRLVKDGTLYWDEQLGIWRAATVEMIRQRDQMELTAEQFQILTDSVKRLGDGYDLLRGRLSHYYDFAAGLAEAMARSEQAGAERALAIQRAKMQAMLELIEEERQAKEELLTGTGVSDQQYARAVKAISEQVRSARLAVLRDWEAALEGAIQRNIQRERRYADEVIRLQKQLREARQATQDLVREVQRRGMGPGEQWADEQAQAQETLARARELLAQGSAESAKAAEELFREAQRQFAALAQEVRDGDQVLVPLKKGIEAAVQGIREAGAGLEESIQRQMQAAKDGVQGAKQAIADLQAALQEARQTIDAITSEKIAPVAEIKVDSREVDAKLAQLDNTVTHSTHIIHVREVMEKRWGGLLARGGKLPGYGGGDRIKALLEAGEYVIRKEAVSRYGVALFDALNHLRFDLSGLIAGATTAALPAGEAARFAAGGLARGGETLTIRLQAGEAELPLQVVGRSSDLKAAVREFEEELSRMRLTRSW